MELLSPDAPAYPRRRRTNADILALTSPSWLIPGCVVGGALNMLTGFAKSGKSYVTLHWALEAAKGGHKVLYVPAEAENQFKPRLQAHLAEYGDEGGDNMQWWYEEEILNDPAQHEELMLSIAADPPALVVVDTLSAAAGGFEENDSGAHVLMAQRAALLTRSGSAVLLVHHTGHNKGRGIGSSAQMRRPAVTLNLTRDDEKHPGYSVLQQPSGGGGGRFAGTVDTRWYEFKSVRIAAEKADDGFTAMDTAHVVAESDGPPAYEGEPETAKLPASVTKEDY